MEGLEKTVKITAEEFTGSGQVRVMFEIPVPSVPEHEEARLLHKTIEDATDEIFKPLVEQLACYLAASSAAAIPGTGVEILQKHLTKALKELSTKIK